MNFRAFADHFATVTRREPYDAADPAQAKKAEDQADLLAEQRRGVERLLMATPAGREWVWAVLTACHIWEKRLSVTGEHENGFFEGEREAGLRLMRLLARTCPVEFGQMLLENDR